jgi:hypothetical protein
MDNIIDMSAEDTQSIGSLIWQPIRFEQSKLSRAEDGCCALVQLVRSGGEIEYHKYTIVFQRRMDPEQPELRFGNSVQCYVLFDRTYDNIDDSLLLAASDVGQLIRVYSTLDLAKAGTELEIRRLCGDSIACQAILPY